MSYSKRRTDWQVRFGQWLARRSLPRLMWFGRSLGSLLYHLPNRRKKIAATNISLCFDQLNEAEQKHLLKATMRSTGQGLMEMIAALWADKDQVAKHFEIKGMEHLQEVLHQGTGCLLLSCHTTSIEWGIRGLNQHLRDANWPVGHMLARQHNNKMLESHLEFARLKFVDKLIDKKNLRSLMKSVRAGHPVYYAPDQNFSYQVEFVDFFGQATATSKGTVWLASKGVPVVPWFCFRTGPTSWQIEVLPQMQSLGSLSEIEALQEVSALFESQIRQHPEQYLWVHRRFKNQPEGQQNPYS